MATVNKASLRTEFDALKARFESLCAEGKMPPESRALVDALLMLFELLMAVFMEKHTPKSPANSGLPPSQSPNDATARTRPGAKGKGPSYNEARCANTRTREHVRVLASILARAAAKTSPTPPAPVRRSVGSGSCGRANEHRKGYVSERRGFQIGRRQHGRPRYGERLSGSAVSENPCTHESLSSGPGRSSSCPGVRAGAA